MKKPIKLYLVLTIAAAGLVGLVLTVPEWRKFITASLVTETTLEQKVVITIPADATPGEQTFNINVEDNEYGDLLAQSEPVTVYVLAETESGVDSMESTSDGVGATSEVGGGGGGEEMALLDIRTYAFAVERGHQLEGKNTSIVDDQGRVVVRLAGNTSVVKRAVRVTRDRYWLYVTARHDKPGPVQVAVYVDGQAWKVFALEAGDDQYRMHRIGLLRDFGGSEISFKFINDEFDRQNVSNEETDRNFFLDAWALSTDPNLDRIRAPYSGLIKGTKTVGINLLPRLNTIIREELGAQFVSWDIWSYYAPRLVAQPGRREAIGTEDRLRTVMKFWRAVRPQRPRGE